jgi:hypothetical protein
MLSPVEFSNAGPLCSRNLRFDAAPAQAQWTKARKKPVCFMQKGLKRGIFNGYNS